MQTLCLQFDGVVMVVSNLNACTLLRVLDISGNMINNFMDAAKAEVLAQQLARLPALRSLRMHVRFMEPDGINVLRARLPH
eukprot:3668905-Rhodomonas_salina.1